MSERPEGMPEEAPADPVEPTEPTEATAPEVTAGPEAAAAGTPVKTGGKRRGSPAPTAPRAPTPSERAVKMTDRSSRYFVIACVAIFSVILVYGLLGGHGGFLTAKPSASAEASASAPVSGSPAGSSSVAPSASAEASASAASSASPAASMAPSAEPSSSPVPSAAASPSPS